MEPASPQLEDGFTRIANELLEALSHLRCPPVVLSLVLAVIRETYGYNRKTAPVSRERLAEIMGVSYDRVRQAVREAETWGLVIRDGRALGLQKDYSKWSKPEGGPSENRKGGLPVSAQRRLGLLQPEGGPSENRKGGLPVLFPPQDGTEKANRKGGLPGKPEGGPSAHKDRKENDFPESQGLVVDVEGGSGGETRGHTERTAADFWLSELFNVPADGLPDPWPSLLPGWEHQFGRDEVAAAAEIAHGKFCGEPTVHLGQVRSYMRRTLERRMDERDTVTRQPSPQTLSRLPACWPADTWGLKHTETETIEALARSPDYPSFPPLTEHFGGMTVWMIQDAHRRFVEGDPDRSEH